jgi:hypothetical protein
VENFFALVMALLIGGMALYAGLSIVRTGRKVRAWPTVPGTIIRRDVMPSTVGAASTPGRRYRAMVRYTYVVDGQTYEGDKILALGGFSGTREAIQKEVDRLGDSVEVHYNPTNPVDACLKAVPSWWALVAFGGAGLCFLIGLVTLVSMLTPGR